MFVIVVAVLFAIPLNRPAQDNTAPPLTTAGMINGRYWPTMSPDEKLAYMIAYSDTVKFVLHLEEKSEYFRSKEALYYNPNSSPNEIVGKVDLLLKDIDNSKLPLPALCYCAGRMLSGSSARDLSDLLTKFRNVFRKGANNWPYHPLPEHNQ
jgi:hypothetical protein